MSLSQLRLFQFRNIVDETLQFDKKNICFVGPNGQGKTNILEAVYLLSYGSSFRTNQDSICIQYQCSEMAISGIYKRDEIAQKIDIRIQQKKKEIRIDDSIISDRKELVGLIPSIVFCHTDIEFAVGSPERRRWFFNQTISLIDPEYINESRMYSRILRERNQALKIQQYDILDMYDEQLVRVGISIQKKRQKVVQAFNQIFLDMFPGFSGYTEPISISYKPQWKEDLTEEEIKKTLLQRRKIDKQMKTTTCGPHRDKYMYMQNSRDFSISASTGQLRLLSLLLRTAQAQYISKVYVSKPVLLIDDVLLELDSKRRKEFMALLPEYEQAFFTFLPDEPFSEYVGNDRMVYKVQNGRFTY